MSWTKSKVSKYFLIADHPVNLTTPCLMILLARVAICFYGIQLWQHLPITQTFCFWWSLRLLKRIMELEDPKVLDNSKVMSNEVMDFDDAPSSFLFCLMCGLIAARINSVHSAHFHCSLVPFSSCSLHHETVAGDSPCNHLFRCDKIPLPLHHARYFFFKPDYPILLQILAFCNILPYKDDWGHQQCLYLKLYLKSTLKFSDSSTCRDQNLNERKV